MKSLLLFLALANLLLRVKSNILRGIGYQPNRYVYTYKIRGLVDSKHETCPCPKNSPLS